MAVGIAPCAQSERVFREREQRLELPTRLQVRDATATEDCAGFSRCAPGADGAAVQKRPVTFFGVEEFIEGWKVADANGGHAALFIGEKGGVKRNAGNEGLGAVDGIDDPPIVAMTARSLLLTKNCLMWVIGGNGFPNESLRGSVGNGDGGGIALDFDGGAGLKVCKRGPPGSVRGVDGERQPWRHGLSLPGSVFGATEPQR